MATAEKFAKKLPDIAQEHIATEVGLKVLEEAGLKLVPGAGWAVTGTSLVKAGVEATHEQAADIAKAKLKCSHIEPVMGREGTTTKAVNYAYGHKSMAFLFEGFALGHPLQADLDVKILSTQVFRWDGKYVTERDGDMHIQPCIICSGSSSGSKK